MTCKCENHLEQFTCSGIDCKVCVLSEENFIENPEAPEERYCLDSAKKKAGYRTRTRTVNDGKPKKRFWLWRQMLETHQLL